MFCVSTIFYFFLSIKVKRVESGYKNLIRRYHNCIEYPIQNNKLSKRPIPKRPIPKRLIPKRPIPKRPIQQKMRSSNNEQQWTESITGTYLSKYVRNEHGQKLSFKNFEQAKTAATQIGDMCGGITLEKGGKSAPEYTLRKGKIAMIDYHKDQDTYGLASWIKK